MRLEEQLRRAIRSQGKADSTADVYWYHVERFLIFAKQKRGQWVHPKDMGERQVEIYLSHLANDLDLAANSQNQAFSAICYLYRHVLKRPLEDVSALRAKRPQRVREVLDQSELVALFESLDGVPLLCARLMYGCNFRTAAIGRSGLRMFLLAAYVVTQRPRFETSHRPRGHSRSEKSYLQDLLGVLRLGSPLCLF